MEQNKPLEVPAEIAHTAHLCHPLIERKDRVLKTALKQIERFGEDCSCIVALDALAEVQRIEAEIKEISERIAAIYKDGGPKW